MRKKVLIKEEHIKIKPTYRKDFYCDNQKCKKLISKDSGYDAFEFEFKITTGDSYPEGGSGTYKYLNLCKKCVEDLIKLLEENNYVFTEKEWNW